MENVRTNGFYLYRDTNKEAFFFFYRRSYCDLNSKGTYRTQRVPASWAPVYAHTSEPRSAVSPILTALPITLQLRLKEAAHLQSGIKWGAPCGFEAHCGSEEEEHLEPAPDCSNSPMSCTDLQQKPLSTLHCMNSFYFFTLIRDVSL